MPSLIADEQATSQAESSAAPSQLTRPGRADGDSGTKKMVAIVATTIPTSGIQKSQW